MRKSLLIIGLLLAGTLVLGGCSRRGGNGSDESQSDVWGLQITRIESMTGLPYVESSVNASDLGTDDNAVVYVLNKCSDYFLGSDGKIDPSYNVLVTKYLVEIKLPNYAPFTFKRNIYVQIAASTEDTETSITVAAVPSELKSQIATIVDAEGGSIEGTLTIRLEGKFGNGEDAYATGKTRLKITSQGSSS